MRLAIATILLTLVSWISFSGLSRTLGPLPATWVLLGILLASLALVIYFKRAVSGEFARTERMHKERHKNLTLPPKLTWE